MKISVAERAPSFRGRRAANALASLRAAASSRKTGTKCEVVLERILQRSRYNFAKNYARLPGKPDFVLQKYRVAIFCDGDFWHGRGLKSRLARVRAGHNSDYWQAKLLANVRRDRRNRARLRRLGWHVLRFWESDLLRCPERVKKRLKSELRRIRLRKLSRP
jgi:DNA mismatch endonuclease (patch repair protein)